MTDLFDDDRPLALKEEDLPLVRTDSTAPRAVRAQIVAIDGAILRHQDVVSTLFEYMPGGGDGRRLLRALFGDLEESHRLLQGLLRTVERGG